MELDGALVRARSGYVVDRAPLAPLDHLHHPSRDGAYWSTTCWIAMQYTIKSKWRQIRRYSAPWAISVS